LRSNAVRSPSSSAALEIRSNATSRLVAFSRTKRHVAAAKLLALTKEIRECLHARAEDVRIVRLRDVVRGASVVSLAGVSLVAMNRRQEDDRHLSACLRRADA
jgi:hypothetical protein